jgi:hypothetical protein
VFAANGLPQSGSNPCFPNPCGPGETVNKTWLSVISNDKNIFTNVKKLKDCFLAIKRVKLFFNTKKRNRGRKLFFQKRGKIVFRRQKREKTHVKTKDLRKDKKRENIFPYHATELFSHHVKR